MGARLCSLRCVWVARECDVAAEGRRNRQRARRKRMFGRVWNAGDCGVFLGEGGANVGDVDDQGYSSGAGMLETVRERWLLQEGGATIGDVDNDGFSALLAAANFGELATAQYCLEHGGADIGVVANDRLTIWFLL
jgi:hypothetical protein